MFLLTRPPARLTIGINRADQECFCGLHRPTVVNKGEFQGGTAHADEEKGCKEDGDEEEALIAAPTPRASIGAVD